MGIQSSKDCGVRLAVLGFLKASEGDRAMDAHLVKGGTRVAHQSRVNVGRPEWETLLDVCLELCSMRSAVVSAKVGCLTSCL